jgi:hypothetical protein
MQFLIIPHECLFQEVREKETPPTNIASEVEINIDDYEKKS